jgi:hypothetical protein
MEHYASIGTVGRSVQIQSRRWSLGDVMIREYTGISDDPIDVGLLDAPPNPIAPLVTRGLLWA